MPPRTPRRGPGRPARPLDRAALLAGARRAFARSGYEGTSMRQVAEEVGITKASVFHHVASKEALYVEVLAAIVGALRGVIDEAGGAPGGLADRLDAVSRRVGAIFADDPDTARLLCREIASGGRYLGQGGADAVGDLLAALAATIEAGVGHPVAPAAVRQLALSLGGMVLLPYAAPEVARALLGADLASPAGRARRADALARHTRLLVEGFARP